MNVWQRVVIELQQLRYAVMAADERSFARAATAFNMKQSTLSRKVLRLEDQLGFRLFDRTTRGACPIDVAMPFIEAARQIIDDLDGLQRQAETLRRERHGRVALGYSGSLFTGGLIRSLGIFIKLYPDIHFDGFERAPERLFEALRDGLVDAIIAPCRPIGRDVMQMPLWQEPVRVCFSSSHRLSAVNPIRWTDMAQEHFVLPAGGLGPIISELLLLQLGDTAAEPDISFQEIGVDSILGLVSITGKATLTTQDLPSHLAGTVHCRDVHDSTGLARINFALHWSRDNTNPALRPLRNVLTNQMRNWKTKN